MATKDQSSQSLSVSAETRNLIGVLKSMNEWYSQCSSAIEVLYGSERAEAYMDADIFPKWQALRDEVFTYLNMAIEGNISDKDKNEI